jgi:GT2 family glycosyltransferase
MGNQEINQPSAAIFTMLYNEYDVIDYSLSQLRKTTTLNLPIYAVDNDYPFLTPDMVNDLQKKHNFTLIGTRHNRGLAGGANELINSVNVDYAIGYDCDSNPVTPGWDIAFLKLIKNTNLAYLSLMLEVSKREMLERGHTVWHYEDYTIWRPHAACVQSVPIFDTAYIKKIGGIQEPKKYYGGLEACMFKYWDNDHQIGYLDGYYEMPENKSDKVNPLYTEYKLEYAHKGYNGSFDDFLKTRQ